MINTSKLSSILVSNKNIDSGYKDESYSPRKDELRKIKPSISSKDKPKTRSTSPKPSISSEVKEDISEIYDKYSPQEHQRLQSENKQLKEHIRQLISGRHSNINTGLSPQQMSPDLIFITSELIRANPALIITPINETTLEVNKRRIIICKNKLGRPCIKIKDGCMCVEEWLDQTRLR